jgi:2-iminobutanoate/2-iminopropanoate deaminase
MMRALILLLALATTPAMATPPKYYDRAPVNGQKLPFSEAVQVGDVLYLSGQIGVDEYDKLPDGIEAQAHQMMKNIGATLERAGLGYDRLFKCTVFLADMKEWGAFNKVYVSYFPDGPLPARAAFGANGLALDARVEMECMAYAGAKK